MDEKAKRVLITGGAGFIGNHLANHLLSSPEIELVLADNLSRGKMDKDFEILLQNSRVKFLNLDLTDLNSYTKLGSGYYHVYHLAAINGTKIFYEMPHEVLRVNTLSLIYMLEWFRRDNRAGKFCFTSSNEAYAGGLSAFGVLPLPTPEKIPLVVDDPYNPRWSYGSTKLVGELFVIHYAKAYDFRALIVRPHNFYGPRSGYGHVIPEIMLRAEKRVDPFPIYGADDTRTFCYISDAIRAMQLLMDSDKTDGQPIETVHIGASDEILIGDLVEKIFKVCGWRPNNLDIKSSPTGSVKRRLADTTKLRSLTAWQPEISLDDGLAKTYDWYKINPDR